MTTGKLIKKYREAKGVTQDALDHLIGTHSQVSRWERDQMTPTIYNLRKIALALDVPMADLVGIEPEIPVRQSKRKSRRISGGR